MQKRKKTSHKKSSNVLAYVAWTLTFIVIALGSFAGGYYIGYDSAKEDVQIKEQKKEEKKASVLKKLEEESDKKEEASVSSRLKEVLKKEGKATTQEKEEIKEETKDKKEETKEIKAKEVRAKEEKVKEEKTEKIAAGEYEDASHEIEGAVPPKPLAREVVKIATKPKLAIIIDDISIKSHVSSIKGLHLPITMSFLPPSEQRPDSNILASKEDFYMVHLPMEAQNFKKEEPFTLKVGDSQEKISQRVGDVKKLFPKVKYINNHAGSKFTSNEIAVSRLIKALNEQNINFIDSRTIASSVVEKVMKNSAKQYVGRDIFLDHKVDKDYIKAQIKKSILVARTHGSAIAIGHPHANTILAISESKELFKDVELVLVDRLY